MPTIIKDESKSMARSHRIFSFIGILLLAVMVLSTFVVLPHSGKTKAAHADTPFIFTADGDYGQSSNTTSNLQYIGNSAANGGSVFNLGLGDFNYSYPTVTAQQWVSFAQTGLGNTTFPFEMTEGDHDTGDMSALINDMPNLIPNIVPGASGAYGQEYYFDFPANIPIARFIMVSPNVSGISYSKGSTDYTWVSNAVSAAKTAGYWVIVGMAEGCLFTYSVSDKQACTNSGKNAGLDLLNLLVSQGVDLILQAHVHNYQASKQLAFNSNCPPLTTTTINQYNSNCVVDATNNMTRGAGTVIVNTGTGGRSLVNILSTDPKANYFRALMGSTTNPTFGVSQFTLSATQLTEKYVPTTSKGTFKDSFTISNNPTTTTTLAQDSFARSNQLHWGTASDGINTWGADANTSKQFSIVSNSGQIAATSSTSYNATLGAPPPSKATSAQVEFTGSISSFSNAYMGATLNYTNKSNWYEAYIDGTNFTIVKQVKGIPTVLSSIGFSATVNTQYTLLFSISGGNLNASVWPVGGTQPGTWMLSIPIGSPLPAGSCGLHVVVQSGVTVTFNSFQATSQ